MGDQIGIASTGDYSQALHRVYSADVGDVDGALDYLYKATTPAMALDRRQSIRVLCAGM